MLHLRRFGELIVALAATFSSLPATASPFVEPPFFTSRNGLLDILMVAKPKPVKAISFTPPNSRTPINPTGWVYEICYRQDATGNQCPQDPNKTSSELGGIRLALQKGDLLKVRLVNQLPAQNKNKVAHYWDMSLPTPVPDPHGINLPLSPTNLHTHGLVVQARSPSPANPTWGDNIYVDLYNPANGKPIPQPHQHGVVVNGGVLDYEIAIPKNEPSGLDWFHPHVHGITSDSLSSGLAGIISVGNVGDYLFTGPRNSAGIAPRFPESQVRNLILKDMQVLAASKNKVQFQKGLNSYPYPVASGEVLDDQQDPQFCAQRPSNQEPPRKGSCPGVNNAASGGSDYTGGRWYFPVSGTVYPTMDVNHSGGEIWRISNVGASATYKLQLTDKAGNYPIILHLVSVDGVSVHIPKGTSTGDTVTLGGARFNVVPCPLPTPSGYVADPICIKDLMMMPGARAEVWATYRDRNGNKVTPPANGAAATLQTVGITTGLPGVGDPWPAVDLAEVKFGPRDSATNVLALSLAGDALAANRPQGIFVEPVPYATPAPLPAGCKALPPGHRRRIFYGLVNVTNPNIFGLGYEEVAADGSVVPNTYMPITAFDPMNPFICLPLGPGQKPVRETWELVNLATELHNYHIHQTRFRSIQPTAGGTSPLSPTLNPDIGAGVVEDNAPLKIAVPDRSVASTVMNSQNGYCTVDQWRSRKCVNDPSIVEIPFAELGEFVYHCHILEHEDAGMMAKIQVVPSPN